MTATNMVSYKGTAMIEEFTHAAFLEALGGLLAEARESGALETTCPGYLDVSSWPTGGHRVYMTMTWEARRPR